MTDDKEEPYIRWYVPRLRRGPPKAVEISRRNWFMRIAGVVVMWGIIIGFFGFLEGIEFAVFLAFFMGFIVLGIAFYGWYSGRAGVGKEPTHLFGGQKRKGV